MSYLGFAAKVNQLEEEHAATVKWLTDWVATGEYEDGSTYAGWLSVDDMPEHVRAILVDESEFAESEPDYEHILEANNEDSADAFYARLNNEYT